jgi:rhodanese-related sulfurtransferase
MLALLRRFALLLVTTSLASAADAPKLAPREAAALVAAGKAVLVDVREPKEWQESGVAAPAVLLPKSDFDGDQKQWKAFLAENKGKQVLVYCRTSRCSFTAAPAGARARSPRHLWKKASRPRTLAG